MRVLVACEESQEVCIAFRERGHEAYSCDIQSCSGAHPEWHIKSNVLPLLHPKWYDLNRDGEGNQWEGYRFITFDGKIHEFEGNWDLIIAHPPCTYMSKAGAKHMYPTAGVVNQDRLEKALAAKEFFMQIFNASCDKICIENPTPLKIVGLPKESQVIQPYQFGHPFSKRTLLWLKGLPKLVPTNILTEYKPYLPSNTGGFSRGNGGSFGVAHTSKIRSKTFPGIASAMADQWGDVNYSNSILEDFFLENLYMT